VAPTAATLGTVHLAQCVPKCTPLDPFLESAYHDNLDGLHIAHPEPTLYTHEVSMAHPIFVSLEGGEASGKTTQAKLLTDGLVRAAVDVRLLQEPGYTPLGSHLRDFLLSEESVSPIAELLLFEAARAELVTKELRPLLERGVCVVTDRYIDSSIAYQGYGRMLDAEWVRWLNTFATQGLTPQRTFLLDLPPEDALRRLEPQSLWSDAKTPTGNMPPRVDEEGQRKFENSSIEFHKRVREGYTQLAQAEPDRWRVIDATLSVEEIHATIWDDVAQLLDIQGIVGSI
jgi:dTMP kinase